MSLGIFGSQPHVAEQSYGALAVPSTVVTLIAINVSGVEPKVLRSFNNGANWVSLAGSGVPAAFNPTGQAYSPILKRIVAVANASANYVCTSDDNGATWTPRGRPVGMGGPTKIAYSASLDLFIVRDSAGLFWSADGINWTLGVVPVGIDDFQLSGIGVTTNLCVITGRNSAADTVHLLRSVDGKTWTATALASRAGIFGWAFGNATFCGVGLTWDIGGGFTAPKVALITADGIASTTTDIDALSVAAFSDNPITFGLGQFVAGLTGGAGGATNNNILTSPDGINFTQQVLPGLDGVFNKAVHAIVFTPGNTFATLGPSTTTNDAGDRSTDFVTWTRVATPAGLTYRAIAVITP